MKKTVFICCLVFVFALTACSGKKSSEPTDDNGNNDNKGKITEKYVPEKAVPENMPIYPGAVMINELPSYSNDRHWVYTTTASSAEIVDFFKTEFQDMGFEVDSAHAYTTGREFYVSSTNYVITVASVGGGEEHLPDEVDLNTPGRHYVITIKPDKWDEFFKK